MSAVYETMPYQARSFWLSFAFSSAVHGLVILAIVSLPSWGSHKIYKTPHAIMVSLVVSPSPSRGALLMPTAPPPTARPPAEKKKATVPPPPAKLAKIPPPPTQKSMPAPVKPAPPASKQEMAAPRMPEPAMPLSPPKVQRSAPPATASPFVLPPLPTVNPREEISGLASGETGREGGSEKRVSAVSSSSAKESGAGKGNEGKVGSGGGPLGLATGLPGVTVDNPDFRFMYYLVIVQNKIGSNWNPPYTGGRSATLPRTVVHFRILRNGHVRDISVETSSGVNLLDQSAVRAITLSSPLPPLPQRFLDDSLGVHFSFELYEGRKG